MTRIHRYTRPLPLRLCLGALLAFATSAHGFSVSQSPLFLSGNVKPNVILGLDDSGSMDSEVLFPTNDGALWWHTGDRSFVGRDANDDPADGVLNYNEFGRQNPTWKKYVYLFPNGHGGGMPDRRYPDATNDHYAIPPRPEWAFARSADYNRQYYDPTRTYEPWASYQGTTFGDSNPTAARFDPVYGNAADSLNLTADLDTSARGAEWDFYLYPGMRRADGSVVNSADNRDFTYYPATYYVRTDAATITYSYDSFTVGAVTVPGQTLDCASSGPAEYRIFESQLTTFNFPAGITALGPDGACLLEFQVRSSLNAYPFGGFDTRTDCAAAVCTYAEEIQNFANWFTYYRRRHHAMRAGMGQSFEPLGGLRVGAIRFNTANDANPPDVTMRDLDVPAERASLYDYIYDTNASGGTPTRETLAYIGEQYRQNTAIIEASCQQNFAIIFTDGFATPNTLGYGQADQGAGEPYADGHPDTLADIAFAYYDSSSTRVPLRSDLNDGPVPVPTECNVTGVDPWVDCNTDLHMNTFAVTLGAVGNLFDPNGAYRSVRDAYASPPAWANPTEARNPVQVDDLYHAAVNGRGEKLSAQNPTEIEDAMDAILGDITDSVGSAASVAANSTRLDVDTLIFQARFDSSTWAGDLIAFRVDPITGNIISQDWNAAALLDARATARNIITYDGTQGIEFAFDNLSAAEQTALGGAVRGRAIVEYLAGDRRCEEDPLSQRSNSCPHDLDGDSNTPTDPDDEALRQRSSRLGDIVNSDPAYSGDQNFGFSLFDTDYASFLASKSSRRPAVLVGANDGMLHAFDAGSGGSGGGEELFAYIPSSVLTELGDLADPNYAHRYYVDGSPLVIDANIQVGGSGPVDWRTLVIGSTGAGGRTVFALDISKNDLSSFDRDDVLWELTDSRLGVSIPRPQVARFAGDTWVLLVPNGYNSDNDRAALLVVDLEDGTILAELDTGVGTSADPNGLGPIVPIDIDSDGEVEYAYAGDMHGNLWRFEFSGNSAGDWSITDYSAVSGLQGLFQACTGTVCSSSNRQPITARPSVTRHPDGGLMILFGTGSYFQTGDNTAAGSTQIQSFYGLRDFTNAAEISGRAQLQEQVILDQDVVDGEPALSSRLTSDNAVSYGTQRGWYLDLAYPAGTDTGERVVNNAIIRDERVIFTSLTPDTGVCSFGGSSWLMVMNAVTGSRLAYSPLDTNNDGVINGDDLVAFDLDNDGVEELVETSGKGYSERIVEFSEDSFLTGGDASAETAYGSGSDGEIQEETFGLSPGLFARQSWFQVNPPVDD
jgi:type IV pilus assembly protein PilY1